MIVFGYLSPCDVPSLQKMLLSWPAFARDGQEFWKLGCQPNAISGLTDRLAQARDRGGRS